MTQRELRVAVLTEIRDTMGEVLTREDRATIQYYQEKASLVILKDKWIELVGEEVEVRG